MGIQVNWDNEDKTRLRYIFDKKWTWDDFYIVVDKAVAMIEEVPNYVGTIFDVPEGVSIPSNMLTHARSLMSRRHPRTVVVVVVARGLYLRTLLQLATKVSRDIAQKLQVASTLDEAHEIVEQRLAEANAVVEQ